MAELDAILGQLEQQNFGAQPKRGNVGSGEYIGNEFKAGAATTLGGVLDAPSRVLNLGGAGLGFAMHELGLTGEPLDVSKYFDPNLFTKMLERGLGVRPLAPPDAGARIVGGAARGVGSLVVPLGASPAALAAQAASAAGGGAGAEFAGEMSGDDPAAMLTGGLVGGVLAPSLLNAPQRLKDIKKALPSEQQAKADAKGVVERMVDKTVKNDVKGVPNAAENIDEALALSLKIPGFKPSVGEMANAPALTGMQANYARLSPKNLNEELARQEGNLKAVEAYLKGASPKDAMAASTVRSAVNQKIATLREQLQQQGDDVAARVPQADQLDVGTRLSQAAQAEKDAMRPVINEAYERAFRAAGDQRIDASRIVSRAEEILGTRLADIKPDSAPQTVRQLSSMNIEGGLTLREVDELRKAINADIGSAGRSITPIAATRLRNLNQLHREIDTAVTGSALPQEAKTAYAEALARYRNDYVPRFKEGANLRMFQDSSTNEPRILPDKVASTYFTTDAQGGQTRAGQFASLFGNNQEARGAMREGILGLYRQKVVDPTTGHINVDAHNRFLRDHANTLRAYGVRGINVETELRGIGAEALRVANATEKFTSLAKSLKFDTVDELADAALKSPKVMGNISMMLNDGQKQTFAKMLMDKAWEQGSSAGMQKFMDENAKTLRMVLSEKHLADLNDVTKALAIIERAPKVGAVTGSTDDALKRNTGVSLATVYAQMRATTAGRQAPITGAFNVATPVLTRLSQTQFDDVMRQALYDPQTAQNLRNFLNASPARAQTAASRLLSGLKTGGQVVWDAKGPIIRFMTGASSYPQNVARSGTTIAGSIREEEANE